MRHSEARFTHFDVFGNLKLNLGWFFMSGGLGVSLQSGDEVKFWDDDNKLMHNYYMPQKNKFLISGIIGLGINFKIYEKFSLICETDIYMREYMGTAIILGGVKYTLE